MKNTKKVSSKIIRAWFDTVLNPLSNSLSLVQSYLKDNNYTWNWNYQNFIEFKKFENYFEFKYNMNYEQVANTEFLELKNMNNEYNLVLMRFNASCIELFNTLINSNELKVLLNDCIEKYYCLSQISQTDVDYLKKIEAINWIAEYLINNKKDLPFDNIFRIIWNNERKNFNNILNIDGIRKYYLEVKENSFEFEQIVNKTLINIREFCNTLSLKYGEPIAI